MAKPRSQQISLLDTPYYHICSRTVRKAFLCGIDTQTGVSFEYRRTWIEQRLFKLAQVFAIDICAHVVMHNHLHLVLHVDSEQVKYWSTGEQLQLIKRMRELAVKHQGACQKQLVSLLLDINTRISNRKSGIICAIESVLEDATNDLSTECRAAIYTAKEHLQSLIKAVHRYDDCLEKSVIAHADCKKLLKLEGVGTMNAINLYLALGCAELGVFNKGKMLQRALG